MSKLTMVQAINLALQQANVSAGDQVQDGDTLMSIETDKAVTDVPAPFTGTIKEIKVKEGDTVQVGDVLVTYIEKGTAAEVEEEEKETAIQESASQKAAKAKDTEEESQAKKPLRQRIPKRKVKPNRSRQRKQARFLPRRLPAAWLGNWGLSFARWRQVVPRGA